MKSLLIVTHGSRKSTSNDEVKLLGDTVSLLLKAQFFCVKIAYLEFASPSIEVAIEDLFHNDTNELIVLPYFLSAGKHVTSDVPDAIRAITKKWPTKTIQILPHIGAMDLMVNLIVSACVAESEQS